MILLHHIRLWTPVNVLCGHNYVPNNITLFILLFEHNLKTFGNIHLFLSHLFITICTLLRSYAITGKYLHILCVWALFTFANKSDRYWSKGDINYKEQEDMIPQVLETIIQYNVGIRIHKPQIGKSTSLERPPEEFKHSIQYSWESPRFYDADYCNTEYGKPACDVEITSPDLSERLSWNWQLPWP